VFACVCVCFSCVCLCVAVYVFMNVYCMCTVKYDLKEECKNLLGAFDTDKGSLLDHPYDQY